MLILVINGWGILCEIALRWISLDFTDDLSTLVQVMAWCGQATSHYLIRCWPRSSLPYGITRPQWVKHYMEFVEHPMAVLFASLCSLCVVIAVLFTSLCRLCVESRRTSQHGCLELRISSICKPDRHQGKTSISMEMKMLFLSFHCNQGLFSFYH